MAGKLSDAQWGDIRTQWISTDRSIRELAREFGVSAPGILKRAEKEAWGPRNAPARKRALVDSAASGLQPSEHRKPQNEPEKAIFDAAEQDIQVMRTAANVARIALERCEALIPHEDDPRNIKTLTEAAKGALETYRKARNLDEPARRDAPTPYASMSDDELEEALARAAGKG